MSNEIKISTVIQTLKTYLEGLSWTSTDGGGTTEFNAVFTYENWNHDNGYPFVVIRDVPRSGSSLTNQDVEIETGIEIHICAKWSIIDEQSDDAQKAEAKLRVREAYDYLKTQLFKYTTIDTLGVDFIFEPDFVDDPIEELDLERRIITLSIKEIVSRQ